jgi:uncharacterized protein (TIGR03086 family)
VDFVLGPDPTAQFAQAAASALVAWRSPGVFDRVIDFGPGPMPGRTLAGVNLLDTATHTWDIAKATGQQPKWDDDVCRLSLDTMHRDLPMADRTPMWEAFKAAAPANMQFDPPFANAVAVGTDAPLIDQLVAWTGRQP